MHLNFYHWHNRVEFKPETAILEARWSAAVKNTKKPSAGDVRSLLRLIFYSDTDPEFTKRFAEGIIKAEPTFPPDNNIESLRVMAAAAVHSQMDNPSHVADALALGLRAADFPAGRLEPVCSDIMTRASDYLASEAERVRPLIYTGVTEAEKQAETLAAALKKAAETNSPVEVGKAAEAMARQLVSVLRDTHKQMGDMIGRMAEESQFLWWLVGQRSPVLGLRRDKIGMAAYALPAAAEAAERVTLLPPPSSAEALLDSVLAQCRNGVASNGSLAELIMQTDTDWVKRFIQPPAAPELVPVSTLLTARAQNGSLDAESVKKLGIAPKKKFSGEEISRQYFRELMFLRAMLEVS